MGHVHHQENEAVKMWDRVLRAIVFVTLSAAFSQFPCVAFEVPATPPGILDVTKAPYFADPSGQADSTAAIQKAVNDARDTWRACYFPSGTYLISDTISCEQTVEKLDRPRNTDRHTQHYWDQPNRIVLIGSTQ